MSGPPLLAVQAPSGTGKTTLLEGVLAELARAGLRVAVLKHSSHDHPLDRPGSDTDRLRAAGAVGTALATPGGVAVVRAWAPGGPRTLAASLFPDVDLVLVEGWRGHGLPVLRLHRTAVPDPTWSTPDPVVAWATDDLVTAPEGALPLDQEAVAAWIRDRLRAGTFQP